MHRKRMARNGSSRLPRMTRMEPPSVQNKSLTYASHASRPASTWNEKAKVAVGCEANGSDRAQMDAAAALSELALMPQNKAAIERAKLPADAS